MSNYSTFDRLVRYSNYLKVYRLEDYERLRPAVALTRSEMRGFMADARHTKSLAAPIIFCGLYIFEAD